MDKNHPERDPKDIDTTDRMAGAKGNAAVPDVKGEPQTEGKVKDVSTGDAGADVTQEKPAGEASGDHLVRDANRSGAFPYEKSQ